MTIANTSKDYYQILGLEAGASVLEIKRAYFSQVRKYPPERFPDDFMEIRQAYELLSNEKTRQEYDSIVQLPSFVRSAFEYARQALTGGNIEIAIKLLEKLRKEYPGKSFVNSLLGEAYLRNGNSVKAIRVFVELIKEHPRNAAFRGHLAHAYLLRGWHLKAIDAYKKALVLDEDNFSLWDGLAQAFAKAEHYEKAQYILQEALRKGKDKNWDNTELYFRLIQLDVTIDDLEGLNRHLEELTNLAISREDIRESIGWALNQLARFMIMRDLTEIAGAMIIRAHRLLPEAEEIVQLKEELDFYEKYREQFARLEEDDRIHEDITMLVGQTILPGVEFADSKLQEVSIFFNELKILDDPAIFSSLKQLQILYPDFYALKKNFFDGVMNARKRKKMLKSYLKKATHYTAMLPLLLDLDELYDDDDEGDEIAGFFDEDDGVDDFFVDDFDPFGSFEPQQPYVREHPKIGRNDPCPCGSGKKYKKCCGR
ncbi:MAG: DnaJ domain-containing protein [Firmicutes bacterium]|nr:DnaJ domain-containing protein [Bacillota bacterium]